MIGLSGRPNDPARFYSPRRLADTVGLDAAVVLDAVGSGDLPACRLGDGAWSIRADDAVTWLDRRRHDDDCASSDMFDVALTATLTVGAPTCLLVAVVSTPIDTTVALLAWAGAFVCVGVWPVLLMGALILEGVADLFTAARRAAGRRRRPRRRAAGRRLQRSPSEAWRPALRRDE